MKDPKKFAHGVTGLTGGVYTNTNGGWGLPALYELTGETRVVIFNHTEYGFRGTHASTPNAAFGCSFTYGHELEEEHTWPYLLGSKNYGVGGGSPQTVARLVTAWIPESDDVENVFVLMPPPARREIYNDLTQLYVHLNIYTATPIARAYYGEHPFTKEENDEFLMRFFEEFPHLNLLDEEQNQQILQECRETVERICEGKNLVMLNSEDAIIPQIDNMSRDKTHGGDVWNRKVSQIFSREMRKLV
jgi:hypothetical protein